MRRPTAVPDTANHRVRHRPLGISASPATTTVTASNEGARSGDRVGQLPLDGVDDRESHDDPKEDAKASETNKGPHDQPPQRSDEPEGSQRVEGLHQVGGGVRSLIGQPTESIEVDTSPPIGGLRERKERDPQDHDQDTKRQPDSPTAGEFARQWGLLTGRAATSS